MTTRFFLWFIVRFSLFIFVSTGLLTAVASPLGSLFPQSSLMAFMSRMDENIDIYVMDVGRHLHSRLTHSEDWERFPAWSPDGKYLAYHSGPSRQSDCSTNYEIYISSLDGRDVRQLTTTDSIPHDRDSLYPKCNAMVDWSQDGERITFHSNYASDGLNYDIFSIKTDGTDLIQLTDLSGDEVLPDFSPDGSKVVYTNGTTEFMFITVVDADGQNPQRLTRLEDVMLPDGTIGTPTLTLEDWHPTWSPDGERIVFVSNRAGYSDIYVMNADGTELTQITNDYFRDYEPIWTSNDEIVFVSDREGTMQIFIMEDTGRNIRRLTRMPQGANAPAWLP